MRHLHLLIHDAQGRPPAGALAGMLARAAPPVDGAGLSALLCQVFGIARQQDWPIAPYCARAAGLPVGDDYWLRLDPVHLDVGMRGPFLHAGLTLAADEVAALHTLVMPLLEDLGLCLHGTDAGGLYLRLPRPPRLATIALDLADGRPPTHFLPRGEDAPTWTRLLNEMQMGLHEHPLNQARLARGQLPVNSLWPWGGGRLAETVPQLDAVWSDIPLACDLARALGVTLHPCPAGARDLLASSQARSLAVLDAAQVEDRLEAAWLRPLLGALRLGRLRAARITWLGEEAADMMLGPLDAWRHWP